MIYVGDYVDDVDDGDDDVYVDVDIYAGDIAIFKISILPTVKNTFISNIHTYTLTLNLLHVFLMCVCVNV